MDDAPRAMIRVVIVNHRAGELLDRCLDAVDALDWPRADRETWVIDNASGDGAVDAVRARDPSIIVIANDTNEGFGANNRAFEDLDGIDHVSLVNPDAAVAPAFLDETVAALEADPGLGAACPKILLDVPTTPPTVQNAGSYLRADGNAGDRGYRCPDGPAFDVAREVDAFCGAAVVLRATMLAEVGGFDERFFLYYEDTDLSWRARLGGWRFGYVPTAVVWHRHGHSTGLVNDRSRILQARNRLVMVTKNATWTTVARAWIRAGAGVVAPRDPSGPSRWARLRALALAVRMLPGTLRRRTVATRGARRAFERTLAGATTDGVAHGMTPPATPRE